MGFSHAPIKSPTAVAPGASAADDLLGSGLGGLTKAQTIEEVNRRKRKSQVDQIQPAGYGDMTLGGGAAARSLLGMGMT